MKSEHEAIIQVAVEASYLLQVKTPLQVLNAHMDSLQWIDSSALAVERKLGEVTRFLLHHRQH